MSGPVVVVAILVSYLAFVLKIGPEFMKERSPYNLNKILVLYNLIQIFISLFVFCVGFELLIENGLILPRQCVTDSEEFKLKTAERIYYYFLAKVTELLDTVFFVLRKRDRQVTFLHVYHHSFAMLCSWSSVKYEPSYITIFMGTVNSFVHIIMYTYYGLSAFPRLNKYLWWKKYITKIQMVQFLLIVAQLLTSYNMSSCRTTYTLFVALTFNTVLFIYLFADFYVKSYLGRNNEIDKSTIIKDSDINVDHININNINKRAVEVDNKFAKKFV